MILVQILLPVTAGGGRHAEEVRTAFMRTRSELVEAFGGVTAYSQAAAEGIWTSPDGSRDVDLIVMVEVVAPMFDRRWWRRYTDLLAERFAQDTIQVRARNVDLIDDRAV